MGISCAEVEVKQDGDGNLWGEVLWLEMVCSTRASLRDRETFCMLVSFERLAKKIVFSYF